MKKHKLDVRGLVMAFLQESEWMFLNEIAYNISFIYSFDDMRKTVLDRLNMLIAFDGAVFSVCGQP